MHRFYAPPENFSKREVLLDAGETRHLRDVLRMRTGDPLRVFDGEGNEFECTVGEIRKKEARLSIVSKTEPSAPESHLDLTIAAAITPPEKFDLVVQKCVELGVCRFVPLLTARCEVKVKDGERKLSRWNRIAFEAAKQCGRARLMKIGEITPVDNFLHEISGPIIMFSERDGATFDSIPVGLRMTAIYGPKGGWGDSELELARSAGAIIITFGGRILRAETAAIGLTAILQHRFGDMS